MQGRNAGGALAARRAAGRGFDALELANGYIFVSGALLESMVNVGMPDDSMTDDVMSFMLWARQSITELIHAERAQQAAEGGEL